MDRDGQQSLGVLPSECWAGHRYVADSHRFSEPLRASDLLGMEIAGVFDTTKLQLLDRFMPSGPILVYARATDILREEHAHP
jgi:hypothetical protein